MQETSLRRQIQAKQFPHGVPRLWCPALTHFLAAKEPDAKRIRAHMGSFSPRVKGILVPGSTGEGWEMNDEDIRTLLAIVLDVAHELGYATWHRKAGGPYDGFLVSTANVFSKQLDAMLSLIDDGRFDAAEALSEKLELVVEQAFSIVSEFSVGNAFANANKVLDHCMAYGDRALRVAPPLLYSGTRLPMNFVENASKLLLQYSLMPTRGYY